MWIIFLRVVFYFRKQGGNKFNLSLVELEVFLSYLDRVFSQVDGYIGLDIGRKVWVGYINLWVNYSVGNF